MKILKYFVTFIIISQFFNSLDLYASVRSLYLQDRNRKIKNLDETTETMNDDDWEEIDTQ